jgi:hypothetical protein
VADSAPTRSVGTQCHWHWSTALATTQPVLFLWVWFENEIVLAGLTRVDPYPFPYTVNKKKTKTREGKNRENKTARFTSSRHRRAKTRRPGGLTHGLGKKKDKNDSRSNPRLWVSVSSSFILDPFRPSASRSERYE